MSNTDYDKKHYTAEEIASISVPVRFQKGLNVPSMTDWSAQEYIPSQPAVVHTSYNLDESRPNGNTFFKRYPDGSLDLDDAKNRVFDCLVKAKNLVPLTDLEKLVLQIHFPANFQFSDPVIADKMRRVNIRISDSEMMIISTMVASHIAYAYERAEHASGS